MKATRNTFLRPAFWPFILPLFSASVSAAELRWDADGVVAYPPEDPLFGTVSDGGGLWDLLTPNFTPDNGITNVPWAMPAAGTAADDIIFGSGGFGGGITFGQLQTGERIEVRHLTFAPLLDAFEYYAIGAGRITLSVTPAKSIINAAQNATISAQLSGRGFVKNGPGRLLLNAPSGSVWDGQLSDFEINDGTLELDAASNKHLIHRGTTTIATGATLRLLKPNVIIDDNSIIHIADGGKFDLNGQAERFGYLSGGGEFLTGGANWSQQFGEGGASHVFTGAVTGSGTVSIEAVNTKSYGTQEFAGLNTFTGKLSITGGTLAFSSDNGLGTPVGDPVIALGNSLTANPVHGVLRYKGMEAMTFSRPLHLAGAAATGSVTGGGGIEASGGDPAAIVTVNSAITTADGAKSFVLGGAHAGDNTLASVLPDGNAGFPVALLKSGSGTWRLNQDNLFTGGVEMNAGTLHLDNPGALNDDPDKQNSLRLHGGTLLLNGNSLVLGSGTASPGLSGAGGSIVNNMGVAAFLSVRQSVAQTQVFRGRIEDTAGGLLSLVKQGTGTLTFMGAEHTYAGATRIEEGTLKLEPVPSAPLSSGLLWNLDASDSASITVTDGAVTQWRDKSGGNRHLAPPTAASTPTYEPAAQNGLNAVRFDGLSDVLALNPVTGIGIDAFTVFIVCSNADNPSNGGIIGGNGLNQTSAERGIRGVRPGAWYGAGSNVDFCTPAGSEFRVNGALTADVEAQGGNSWHIVSALRGGTGAIKLNSVGGFTATTGTPVPFWFRGDIGQVLVYGRALSAEERHKVEAWLKQKWFGGAATSNFLPPATAVSVEPAATFDSGAPQTVAGLTLSGALKIGAPAGELVSAGATAVSSGATLHWDVSDWNGAAGSGYDVLTTDTLTFSTVPEAPVVVKIGQSATVANAGRTARDFTLIRSAGAVTGFEASHFSLDATAFTAVPGAWSIVKSGNHIVLHFEPAPAGPYDLWVESFGLTGAAAAASSDPDGDGWANVLEFGVNGNPANRSITAAVTERVASVSGEQAFTITLPVRSGAVFAGADALTATADGVIYTIEGSDDLGAWLTDVDEVTPPVTAGLPALPSGWEYRTFRSPGSVHNDAADFMRVKLQATP